MVRRSDTLADGISVVFAWQDDRCKREMEERQVIGDVAYSSVAEIHTQTTQNRVYVAVFPRFETFYLQGSRSITAIFRETRHGGAEGG